MKPSIVTQTYISCRTTHSFLLLIEIFNSLLCENLTVVKLPASLVQTSHILLMTLVLVESCTRISISSELTALDRLDFGLVALHLSEDTLLLVFVCDGVDFNSELFEKLFTLINNVSDVLREGTRGRHLRENLL